MGRRGREGGRRRLQGKGREGEVSTYLSIYCRSCFSSRFECLFKLRKVEGSQDGFIVEIVEDGAGNLSGGEGGPVEEGKTILGLYLSFHWMDSWRREREGGREG